MATDSPQKRFTPLDPKKYPKNIWEKHPDETSIGFQYFVTYRNMGALGTIGEKRSLERAAAIHGKCTSNLSYYSAPCEWTKRCEAYDAYLSLQIDKEKVKSLKEMSKRHINNMRAATTALMLPINEVLVRFRDNPKMLENMTVGDLLEITNKNAGVLTRMVDTERKVNDQPNEIVKNEFGEGAPQILVAMPDLTPKLKEKIQKRNEDLRDDNTDN